MIIEFEGKNTNILDNCSGGYRIQRVPPTESKGRVHTSTVTVAIMNSRSNNSITRINSKDIKLEWFGGTVKAGGQHRNKHENSCRMTHIPSGIKEIRQGRNRKSNYDDCYEALSRKISQLNNDSINFSRSKERKEKIGSGQRGDKIITIRFQDNTVINHLNGNKSRADKFMKGDMKILT